MPRCGCTGGSCACLIQGVELDCINVGVSGLGTNDMPYKVWATPVIDPDPENILDCGPDGLIALAPVPEEFALDVFDTDCISMSVTGAGTVEDPFELSAELVIHPDYLDCLSCSASGLQLNLDPATLECGASGLTVVGGGGGGSADETLFWTLAGGI